MSYKPCILVIDDEPQIHRFLGPALEEEGYSVVRADTGASGLEVLATRPPDALILDLGLPDMDGAVLLKQARHFFGGPILVVSARGDPAVKIQVLDLGADDYVQKPFVIGELLARLRAARRNKPGAADALLTVRAGDIDIDLTSRLVRRGGDEVRLTTYEYNLLSELAKSAGRVMTHRQLLLAVWGPHDVDNVQYLRVVVQRLRGKLEADPAAPRHILTETGVGYRLRI